MHSHRRRLRRASHRGIIGTNPYPLEAPLYKAFRPFSVFTKATSPCCGERVGKSREFSGRRTPCVSPASDRRRRLHHGALLPRRAPPLINHQRGRYVSEGRAVSILALINGHRPDHVLAIDSVPNGIKQYTGHVCDRCIAQATTEIAVEARDTLRKQIRPGVNLSPPTSFTGPPRRKWAASHLRRPSPEYPP